MCGSVLKYQWMERYIYMVAKADAFMFKDQVRDVANDCFQNSCGAENHPCTNNWGPNPTLKTAPHICVYIFPVHHQVCNNICQQFYSQFSMSSKLCHPPSLSFSISPLSSSDTVRESSIFGSQTCIEELEFGTEFYLPWYLTTDSPMILEQRDGSLA